MTEPASKRPVTAASRSIRVLTFERARTGAPHVRLAAQVRSMLLGIRRSANTQAQSSACESAKVLKVRCIDLRTGQNRHRTRTHEGKLMTVARLHTVQLSSRRPGFAACCHSQGGQSAGVQAPIGVLADHNFVGDSCDRLETYTRQRLSG